jgi:hypothetical protein
VGLTRRQLVFVLLLSAAGSALPAACQNQENAIVEANREIGISFAPSLIAYREYKTDGTVQDSEHGWISGLGANASLMRDTLKMTNLLFEATYDYNDGASKHWSENLSSTGPPTLHYMAPFKSNDLLLGIGRGFMPNAKLLLAPGIEAEYREWHRDLPEALLSIEEEYTFWAPGVDVSCSYSPFHLVVLKTRLGFQYPVAPTNAGIGNPTGAVPNFTFALGHRPVWQADLGIDWAFSRSVHAIAGIDYSHFGFGKSAVASYYDNGVLKGELEPSSVTDLAKVNMGLAWSF